MSIMCLATLSFGASDFIKAHRPQMKKPLPTMGKKVERKVVRMLPKPKQEKKKETITLSWVDYLRNLQTVAADFTTYDFEGNIHPYFTHINVKAMKNADIESLYAIKDYIEITIYFLKTYNIDPQQGTLEQYKEFYKAFNNLSPREYNVLPTIAIWKTGSVEAIIPFRLQMKEYWSDPQLAALAYDTMAAIDYQATQRMMDAYLRIPAPSDIACEENQQMVKKFFEVWRSQADKNLPSVKDADKLEALVLTR